MTLDELNKFFDTYDKVESRIQEVAPLCTNICDCEEITGFSNCGDGDICVRVWSGDCGNDAYYFPLEYLTMSDGEIKECERRKAEEQKKIAEEEERKEKKRLEQKERREYERLKKKIRRMREVKSIMGRESVNPQCWECANSDSPKNVTGGSRFYCSFLEQEFGTWHYDVPNECPCKGRGWCAKEGGIK